MFSHYLDPSPSHQKEDGDDDEDDDDDDDDSTGGGEVVEVEANGASCTSSSNSNSTPALVQGESLALRRARICAGVRKRGPGRARKNLPSGNTPPAKLRDTTKRGGLGGKAVVDSDSESSDDSEVASVRDAPVVTSNTEVIELLDTDSEDTSTDFVTDADTDADAATDGDEASVATSVKKASTDASSSSSEKSESSEDESGGDLTEVLHCR